MRVKRKSTPPGNRGAKVRSVRRNRQPYHKYHHRDGYWLGNTPESSPGHRGRSNHNLRGHVRWERFRLGNTHSRGGRGGFGDDLESPLLL